MDDIEVTTEVERARSLVENTRRQAAVASARLAAACVRFADLRIADDRRIVEDRRGAKGRMRPGEFVADEVSLLVREQPYHVRSLLGRTRRLHADVPTVWAAYCAGEVDAEQVRVIDRVARRVAEARTLTAIDAQAVAAAQTRTPKSLAVWLLRLVVQCEPCAFEQRHRKALAERRVTVVQGADGIGYVTGEVSAADAAAIDARLAAAARSLGADDPRTEQQRRADCFADLLLGRLVVDEPDDLVPDDLVRDGLPPDDVPFDQVPFDDAPLDDAPGDDGPADDGPADDGPADDGPAGDAPGGGAGWLEVEDIDLDTGELLGSRWQGLGPDGEPIGELIDAPPGEAFQRPGGPGGTDRGGPGSFRLRHLDHPLRIGVVVPLASLLGLDDTPAELADRSGLIPAQLLRETIAAALDSAADQPGDQVLFTRLLTDQGGRLLDTTELGRYPSRRLAEAIRIRAGTCRYPTCSVPADRCDADHHQPWPHGPTAAANLDPTCRRHHRGKTFAWLASVRDDDAVDWTMPDAHHYRCTDDPLPTGQAF